MAKFSQVKALVYADTPMERAIYCFEYAHQQNPYFKLLHKDGTQVTKEDFIEIAKNSDAFSYSSVFSLTSIFYKKSLIQYAMDEFVKCEASLPDGLRINNKLPNQESYWHSNVFPDSKEEDVLDIKDSSNADQFFIKDDSANKDEFSHKDESFNKDSSFNGANEYYDNEQFLVDDTSSYNSDIDGHQ